MFNDISVAVAMWNQSMHSVLETINALLLVMNDTDIEFWKFIVPLFDVTSTSIFADPDRMNVRRKIKQNLWWFNLPGHICLDATACQPDRQTDRYNTYNVLRLNICKTIIFFKIKSAAQRKTCGLLWHSAVLNRQWHSLGMISLLDHMSIISIPCFFWRSQKLGSTIAVDEEPKIVALLVLMQISCK